MLSSLVVVLWLAIFPPLDAAPYELRRSTANTAGLESRRLPQIKRQLLPDPSVSLSILPPLQGPVSEISVHPSRTVTPSPPITFLPFPSPTPSKPISSSLPSNLPPSSEPSSILSSISSILQSGGGLEPTTVPPNSFPVPGFPGSIFEPGPVDPTIFSDILPPTPDPSPIISLPIPVFTPVSVSEPLAPPGSLTPVNSTTSSTGPEIVEPTRTFGIPFSSSVSSVTDSIATPGPAVPRSESLFSTPIPAISIPLPIASSVQVPSLESPSPSPSISFTRPGPAEPASISNGIPPIGIPRSRLGPGPVRPSISELPNPIPTSEISTSTPNGVPTASSDLPSASDSGFGPVVPPSIEIPSTPLPTNSDSTIDLNSRLPPISLPTVSFSRASDPIASSDTFVFSPTINIFPSISTPSDLLSTIPNSLASSSVILGTLGNLPSSGSVTTPNPSATFPTISDLTPSSTLNTSLPDPSRTAFIPGPSVITNPPSESLSLTPNSLANNLTPSSVEAFISIPEPTEPIYIIVSPTPNSNAASPPSSVAPNDCPTISTQCCETFLQGKDPLLDDILGSLGVQVEVKELADVWIGLTCEVYSNSAGGELGPGQGNGNSSCTQLVCCNNNTFSGVISIGCSPIAINL